MEKQDVATILSNLTPVGTSDTAVKVLDLYERVMKVYEPTERRYRAALAASAPATRTSTSANYTIGA